MFDIVQSFETGLVRSGKDGISAVSPDGMSVVSFDLTIDTKLSKFIADGEMPNVVQSDDGMNLFMMGLEYKHKSANLTIQKTRGIVENILHNEKFKMLDLRLQSDQDMFRKCIPIVDYRVQVINHFLPM